MNAYTGTDPFIFISYSHNDKEFAEKAIIGLKHFMCRVWYDEGLTPGESWNEELAERINSAEAVVVLLSKDSVESVYVRKEINYAVSKGKKIYSILLPEAVLSAGMELMLSDTQFINAQLEDVSFMVEKLVSLLPDGVFESNKIPFLETGEYSFFFEKEVQLNDPQEKYSDKFWIVCKSSNGTIKKLFDFEGSKAYDIDFHLTQCKCIKDDYYIGPIRGIWIVNVLAKCELDYPIVGPSFNILLILVLRIPENEFPVAHMIDYQCIKLAKESFSLKEIDIVTDVYGRDLINRCKEKLYCP